MTEPEEHPGWWTGNNEYQISQKSGEERMSQRKDVANRVKHGREVMWNRPQKCWHFLQCPQSCDKDHISINICRYFLQYKIVYNISSYYYNVRLKSVPTDSRRPSLDPAGPASEVASTPRLAHLPPGQGLCLVGLRWALEECPASRRLEHVLTEWMDG